MNLLMTEAANREVPICCFVKAASEDTYHAVAFLPDLNSQGQHIWTTYCGTWHGTLPSTKMRPSFELVTVQESFALACSADPCMECLRLIRQVVGHPQPTSD